MGAIQFDTERMLYDLAAKGFTMTDLARRARVSNTGVTLFLQGKTRSAKMAKKLATALGYSVRRYIVSRQQVA